MAELTVFGYRALPTVVHRLDARVKLAAVAAMSMVTLHASTIGLTLATLAIGGVLTAIRFRFFRFLREFKWFLLFVLGVGAIRGLAIPGTDLPFPVDLPLSAQGLMDGAFFIWRLLLIMWIGVILTATTPVNLIRSAVEWFLTPLPWVPKRRIGLLVGLLMRFIPSILSLARSVDDAQRARGVEGRKNPLYRVAAFSMALMRLAFANADHLAMAMEARCYSEHRSERVWQLRAHDRWTLILLLALGSAMVIL